MCTSQVKAIHAATGGQVRVVRPDGRLARSEVFENNRKITSGGVPRANILVNGPGARPYIAGKTETRWTWRKWAIAPGEIFFNDMERAFAEPYRGCVMVEPHTKVSGGNKSWPWDRWQAVVDAGGYRFVQCGPIDARHLIGVEPVLTTFRYAAAVLSVARAFVGCEGALHHAAAAVGTPAVVLWSEFISPEFTGYPFQRNIRHAGVACGNRFPCDGCRKSMDAISVEEVLSNLEEVLK